MNLAGIAQLTRENEKVAPELVKCLFANWEREEKKN